MLVSDTDELYPVEPAQNCGPLVPRLVRGACNASVMGWKFLRGLSPFRARYPGSLPQHPVRHISYLLALPGRISRGLLRLVAFLDHAPSSATRVAPPGRLLGQPGP